MKDFYITLLSNSSVTYFPENKTSSFITQMPHSIHLEGEWVVGLAEFQYPCSMLTIDYTDHIVYIEKEKEGTYKTKLRPGVYNDVKSIVEELNTNIPLIFDVKFELDASQKVSFEFLNEDIKHISFSPKLALQLGFQPYENLHENLYRKGNNVANVLLGLPCQMFVYCDIIEPQIVGDYFTKLLRNVSVDHSKYFYGSTKSHDFNPIHYVPLLKREFENIEIDIRSDTGDTIPFSFGTSSVKLHFKKLR